ncbi:MAG: discoidin domain-containing protein, partial [Lentisphaeraceae bacterium]|nr:discoidin domain-containing protein [Lentisphaeraceae bacterium]
MISLIQLSRKMKQKNFFLLILIACIVNSLNAEISVQRLNNSLPIIDKQSFADLGVSDDGSNINGPSVIRLPDWLADEDKAHPNAVYYMYFGHHGGKYIRLAWAENLEGPWTIFNTGTNDDPRVNGRGVLDLGSADEIEFPSGARVYNHIASPDIVIDHEKQEFALYFHGPANSTTDGNKHFDTWYQKSFVATSKYGLNFNCPDSSAVTGGVGGGEEGYGVKNSILGNAYFRTFSYENELYAFSNYGPIWKAPSTTTPWDESDPRANSWQEGPLETNPIFADLAELYNEEGPRAKAGNSAPRTGAPRHFATHLKEDGKTLEVWYTSRGDMPERIFSTTIDLSQNDWQNWDSKITNQESVHTEMLRPEVDWEGVNYPLAISANGSESGVNQLRDPALFQDTDGKRYLFYSGAGEEGIGIASIIETPVVQKLTVTQVTASNQQNGNPASNVLDGDLNTRWSSKTNGVSLTLTLDDFYAVSSIKMATYFGSARKAMFDLEYSLDGTDW